MLPPKELVVPLRSGETAPFQTKSDGSFTTPDWKSEPLGLISYQRSSVPAPPATAWAVQIATAFAFGSTAATAASKRPSSVSRRYELPFCGALGGIEYDAGTVTFVGP